MTLNKEKAIQKITEMSAERVSKVLIFMAGMEAEKVIDKHLDNMEGVLSNERKENKIEKEDIKEFCKVK